jgi:WD40 repeat protein
VTSPVEVSSVDVRDGPALRLRPGCAVVFVLLLIALAAVPGVALYWAQVRRSQGVHVITNVKEGVRNVAFVASGEVAVLRGDGTVARFTTEGKATKAYLWGTVQGTVLEVVPGADAALVGGDPLLLVDLGDGSATATFGSTTPTPRQRPWRRSGNAADARRATVSQNGRIALLAGAGSAAGAGATDVSVIDLRKKKILGALTVSSDPCAVALSPDGRLALVTTDMGTCDLFDVRKRTQLRSLSTASYAPSGTLVAWAADGKHAVTTDYTGLTVWDTTNWSSTTLSGGVRGEVACVALSADGLRAATLCDGRPNRVLLWDLALGTQLLDAKVPGRQPVALAFDASGRSLVGASEVRGGEGVVFRIDLDEAGK